MSNNYYLYRELSGTTRKLQPEWEPLVRVSYKNKEYRIYVPDADEYVVTVDVVKKALDIGANTISYAKAWRARTFGRGKNLRQVTRDSRYSSWSTFQDIER